MLLLAHGLTILLLSHIHTTVSKAGLIVEPRAMITKSLSLPDMKAVINMGMVLDSSSLETTLMEESGCRVVDRIFLFDLGPEEAAEADVEEDAFCQIPVIPSSDKASTVLSVEDMSTCTISLSIVKAVILPESSDWDEQSQTLT